MSRVSRNRLRLVTTIILSYLLSVFLLIFISGMVVLQTALNPEYMEERVDEVGFAEDIYSEIREIFLSYASASGIPHDVMLEGIALRHVDNAIKSNIMHAFSTGAPYDYMRHENELFEIFLDYAISQGAVQTEELYEGLCDLASLSMEAFNTHTNPRLLLFLVETISPLRQLLTIAIAVAAALSVLIMILLPLINRRVTKWIDGYLYALGAVAIYCVAIPTLALGTGWTQRLYFEPMSFNRLISAWIEGIIGGFTLALIPVLLLIVVLLVIRFVRRYRRRHRA